MKTIDFHLHTTASDGSETPEVVIQKAIDAGLSAMAITDHDTLDGYFMIKDRLKEFSIIVIPGVEFSTRYQGLELHIVGLFPHKETELTKEQFDFFKESRTTRNKKMIDALNGLGFQVTMDEVFAIAGGNILTRAHFAQLLVNKGYCKDFKAAFTDYLSDGKPGYVPREKLTPEMAIKMIHTLKGVAILAHPLLYPLTQRDLIDTVARLSEVGLDGIEVYYSTHSKSDQRFLAQIVKNNHLIASGGSDYHGTFKPHIQVGIGQGTLSVPYACLDNMEARIQQRLDLQEATKC